MTNFETPNEALLRAENERLRAENAYLKQAFSDIDNNRKRFFTPVAMVEEMQMAPLPMSVTIPCAGSIQGALANNGNYHVIARLSHLRAQPEDLEIRYYADANIIKGNAQYFVNELFPYLHQRFISALANAIEKPRKEVA